MIEAKNANSPIENKLTANEDSIVANFQSKTSTS